MSAGRSSSSNTDVPISSRAQDRLGRADLANRIAQAVTVAAGGPSVVFGLAGEWGGGKSSMLNMIDESLDDDWTVRRFTPWAASDPGTLIAEFYATISAALKPKLRKRVKASMATMLTVGSAAAEMIPVAGGVASAAAGQAQAFLSKPTPFDEQFRELSTELSKAATRILVIVDDLDRLHSDELALVMKTVRLLGNFPGIHYLLSYDERTVTDVLKSTDIADGSSQRALKYLEKIVQYPFSIPPLQPAHRDRELRESLSAVADRCGIELESNNIVGPQTSLASRFLELVPDDDLTTLRSIRRLCAQFEVALLSVGLDEVDYLDLLLITHLRVAYPEVHRLVGRFQKILVSSRTLGQPLQPDDAPTWPVMIEKALPETDSWTQIALLDLLHFMFERIPRGSRGFGNLGFSRYANGRISDPDYFDRYVFLTLPYGDIGDAQVMRGLEDLALTGQLAPDSQLYAALNDDRMRLAASKCAGYLAEAHVRNPFTESTAEMAASLLCSMLIVDPSRGSVDAAAAKFVGGVLMHAMGLGAVEDDGQAVLDRFEREHGLVRTTLLLADANCYPQERNESDEGRKKTWLANHRQRQLDACLRDITAETEVESGLLTFWRFLDKATKDRMSALALSELENGRDVLDIAQCFVDSRPGPDGNRTAGSIYANEFEALVPRQHWQVERVNSFANSVTDPDPVQRRRVAHYWMSQELYSSREELA